MQFNQSIPLLSRPKFSEGTKLSSSRDDRNNAFLWKKGALSAGQLDATNQAIEKLSREFSKQRRKPLGGFVPQEPINAFYPFKIYQPSNVSSFLTGITFLDPSSGVGTVCNIDSTVPTNFASTPPTVNPSETWRFWSVRSGQVEIRPIYTLLLLGNEYYSDDGDLIHDPNNWGWKYEVSKNSDGNSPFVHRSDDIDYDSQTTETILPPLIINDNNNFAGAVSLYLWVQIKPDTDDTALPSASIAGFNGSDPFSSEWPDSNSNMIPIGIVSNVFSGYIGGAGPIFYSNDFSVQQNVFDHILNRFPPGNGNFGYVYGGGFNPNTLNTFSVGAMNFRGVISTHAVGLNPIDLGTQIFYPGDCVTYVSGSNAGTIYQYINTYPYVFPETPGASNGWNQILNGVPGTAPNDLP